MTLESGHGLLGRLAQRALVPETPRLRARTELPWTPPASEASSSPTPGAAFGASPAGEGGAARPRANVDLGAARVPAEAEAGPRPVASGGRAEGARADEDAHMSAQGPVDPSGNGDRAGTLSMSFEIGTPGAPHPVSTDSLRPSGSQADPRAPAWSARQASEPPAGADDPGLRAPRPLLPPEGSALARAIGEQGARPEVGEGRSDADRAEHATGMRGLPRSAEVSMRGRRRQDAGEDITEVHVHIGRIELSARREPDPRPPVPRAASEPAALEAHLAKAKERLA